MNMTVCMEASKEYFINYITTMDFDMGKLCLPFVQTYGFIETSKISNRSRLPTSRFNTLISVKNLASGAK